MEIVQYRKGERKDTRIRHWWCLH